MKKQKWDPRDWQGRSRRQVEEHNILMFYTVLVGVVAFSAVAILSAFGLV